MFVLIFNRQHIASGECCQKARDSWKLAIPAVSTGWNLECSSWTNTATTAVEWHFTCFECRYDIYFFVFTPKGLFTWSGGPRSSGVGFFCFHALEDTKQKKPNPLDRGPPLHVNRVLITNEGLSWGNTGARHRL